MKYFKYLLLVLIATGSVRSDSILDLLEYKAKELHSTLDRSFSFNAHIPLEVIDEYEDAYVKAVIAADKSPYNLLTEVDEFKNFVRRLGTKRLPNLPYPLVLNYLLIKMLYGDSISLQAFRLILKRDKPKGKQNERNIQDIIGTAEELASLGLSFDVSDIAKYVAYKFLSDPNNIKHLMFFNFIETRKFSPTPVFLQTSMKAKGWKHIKYYKKPKSALNSGIYTHFPQSKKAIDTPDCNFDTGGFFSKFTKEYVTFKSGFYKKFKHIKKKLDKCPVLILGPGTFDHTQEFKLLKVKIIGKMEYDNEDEEETYEYILKYNQKKDVYNCHGFASGVIFFTDRYINSYGNENEVENCTDYKFYITQIKEVFKGIKIKERELTKRKHKDRLILREALLGKVRPNSLVDKMLNEEEEFGSYLKRRVRRLNGDSIEKRYEQLVTYCSEANLPKDGTILLYAKNGSLSHSALYVSEIKTWVSKCGSLELVTHDFEHLNGKIHGYGVPEFFVCPDEMPGDWKCGNEEVFSGDLANEIYSI